MGAASEAALEESGLVSNPAEVIKARKNLCITMSDQVPIWGKAVSQKVIFAEHELAGCRYQDPVNFREVRGNCISSSNSGKQCNANHHSL